MQNYRKIIHIDMDCFYAAVERLDNNNLAGKAIVVGHDSDRGVVATASYEARRYGVHSAQSIRMAKRLCPNLLIIEPRFERYKEISNKIHNIFHSANSTGKCNRYYCMLSISSLRTCWTATVSKSQ